MTPSQRCRVKQYRWLPDRAASSRIGVPGWTRMDEARADLKLPVRDLGGR